MLELVVPLVCIAAAAVLLILASRVPGGPPPSRRKKSSPAGVSNPHPADPREAAPFDRRERRR